MQSLLKQSSDVLDQTVTPSRYHLAVHDLMVSDVLANPENSLDWEEFIETPAGSYRPVPQARAFHQSDSRFRWALGGNRSSKSHALCHEIYWQATGTHPYLPSRGGVQCWYATPTFELVGSIVWPKLKLLVGNDCTISWYNRAEDIPRSITIPTKDGPSKITFKAYEQGREVFQGTEMAFVGFDEQCPQDVFVEAISRIGASTEMKFAAAFTPIDPQPWLEERLTNKRPADWAVFEFPLDDNRSSCGGFIQDSLIDAMIEMWPPEVRATRRSGKWGSFLGSVYQTFDRQIHVVDEKREQELFFKNGKLPPGSDIIGAIDWGGANPFVFIWVAKIPHLDMDFYVYDEYYWNPKERGARRLEEHANEIKARNLKWGMEPVRIWADHDPTDVLEFYHMGIASQPAEKDRRPGIEAVRAMLNPRQNLSNEHWKQGRPRLHFAARCENAIREHAGYRWKTGTDRQDAPDEPMKINDHTCFPAGQLIDTPSGPRAIESIRRGDEIVSHIGIARADTDAVITGEKPVFEVEFEDGRVIVCTAEHPLLSSDGWINAGDSLWKPILHLSSVIGLRKRTTATRFTSPRMAVSCGGDTRKANTAAHSTISEGHQGKDRSENLSISGCTSRFLRTFMEKSPMAMSSIMTTKIRGIMSRGTSNQKPQATIPSFTKEVSQRQSQRPRNGIVRTLAGNGIGCTAEIHGQIGIQLSCPVNDAEKSTRRAIAVMPNSVLTHVVPRIVEKSASITSTDRASFAINCSLSIATQRRALAPRNAEVSFVVSVRRLGQTVPVYSLASSDGTYCVNGAIVSNCDATRYVVYGEKAYEPFQDSTVDAMHGRYRRDF